MHKDSISIMGCGWLGLPLAKYLLKKGWKVKGSTTSKNKIKELKSKGIEPYLLSLGEDHPMLLDFLSSRILIVGIPSKDTNRFHHLTKTMAESKIKNVLFISSTSVYLNNNQLITEDSTTTDNSLIKIENLFRSNDDFNCTIIRFAGLIGGERHPGNWFKNGKMIPNPDGYVNMIHRDDCIGIINEIIDQKKWSKIYNACTDTHPTRREFYTKAFQAKGREQPFFLEREKSDFKIISNKLLKEQLNYTFIHPDIMAMIA